MLTTSENNYKRSLFSFQQSCINQIMTQSIGIHLKWKMRVVKQKKNKKQISFQLKLERRHWLSTSKQWGEEGSDCMYHRDSITTESMQQCSAYKSFWGGLHHASVFFFSSFLSTVERRVYSPNRCYNFSTVPSLTEVVTLTQKCCSGIK